MRRLFGGGRKSLLIFHPPWLRARNYVRHITAALSDRKLFQLQRKLFQIWRQQEAGWDKPIYWRGWFYQSMPAVQLLGWRDTPGRLQVYQLGRILGSGSRVLDVGANCGFIPLSLADSAAHWTCVEANPYLCEIGRTVAAYLDITNVEFVACRFEAFRSAALYDVICSFASHATADGNSTLHVEAFFDRIDALLVPGGYLVFESQNDEAHDYGGTWTSGGYGLVVDAIARRFDVQTHFPFRSPEYTLRSQRTTGATRNFLLARKPLRTQDV